VQLFTIVLGASLLPVAVAQDDRTDLYLRLSAREQLLRGAIVSAHAGFILARREDEGTYRVVESNPNGERMLASWLTLGSETTTVDKARLTSLIASSSDGMPTSVEFPGEVHLDLTATPVAGDKSLVLIQAMDITEQRKAAQALTDAFAHERETAERMRALAEQKDEFLSSVSHELRTPVTSILGYSEELSEADLPPSERHSVEVITRNARRLAQLVDDLLSTSRRAGLPPLETTEVDVGSAISDCVAELSPLADRAQVTVEVKTDEDFVITVDPLGLDRILVNLLANAIKFTPPGGRIDITTSANINGFAHIEVADTGRGIPPSELNKVFERFYRVTDRDTFVAGTGLGLPIVRDLATRMGGSVELRSDGATGTTAIVELPLHATVP
jgi:two-component system phosphate regulon sensor histidine kinase PhoR